MRWYETSRGILFPCVSDRQRETCRHQLRRRTPLLFAELVRVSPGAQLGTLHVTILLGTRRGLGFDRRRLDGIGTTNAARYRPPPEPAALAGDDAAAAGPSSIFPRHGMGSRRRHTKATTPCTVAGMARLCGSLRRQPGASGRRAGLSEGAPRPHTAAASNVAGTRRGRDRRRHGRAPGLREAASDACRSFRPATAGHGRRTNRPSTGPSPQDQRPLAQADGHSLNRAAEADRPFDAPLAILRDVLRDSVRKRKIKPVSFGKPLYDPA